MLQNQLPGKASDTRARRSTSAIMRNMTKPRYTSMATLRATGDGLGTECFAIGEDSRADDSSTGGKSHLPNKFSLEITILAVRAERHSRPHRPRHPIRRARCNE